MRGQRSAAPERPRHPPGGWWLYSAAGCPMSCRDTDADAKTAVLGQATAEIGVQIVHQSQSLAHAGNADPVAGLGGPRRHGVGDRDQHPISAAPGADLDGAALVGRLDAM